MSKQELLKELNERIDKFLRSLPEYDEKKDSDLKILVGDIPDGSFIYNTNAHPEAIIYATREITEEERKTIERWQYLEKKTTEWANKFYPEYLNKLKKIEPS